MVRIDGSFFCRLELHRSSVDLEEGVMGRTRYVPNLLEMFRGTLFFCGDASETTGPKE